MVSRNGGRRRTRGAGVAVELVFVLPWLLLIFMGCWDFGRWAYTSIAVANGARAGASYGSTHEYATSSLSLWQQQCRNVVVESMSDHTPGNIVVSARKVVESPTLNRLGGDGWHRTKGEVYGEDIKALEAAIARATAPVPS